jgi:hypothetical protein
MGRRNQAEEITQAADRIVEATQGLAFTINRLIESQNWFLHQLEQQSPAWGYDEYQGFQGRARLSEEEAIAIAGREVSEVRRLSDPRRVEMLPPPSAEEIEEWERRREKRRHEGHQ